MIDALIASLPWLALGLIALSAMIDVRKFEIPDTISILVAVLALVYGLTQPRFPWLSHLIAPILVFLAGLFAFARGWFGGGDVKLLTAISVWAGLGGLPTLIVAIAAAGGVLTLLLLSARRIARREPSEKPDLLAPNGPTPYAVAMLAGVVWWAWATHPFH
jgi:prepilin peptidase CpaA